MRLLLQRVSQAQVVVGDEVVGQVGLGYLALLGVTHGDSQAEVDKLAHKLVNLRVFDDERGKLNLSLLDVGGGVLLVSQFTLYANARGGRRPDFLAAARPEHAEPLVQAFAARLRALGVQHVEQGRFGAAMRVSLTNEGPVTLWLDSAEL
ncbi:MAG: D-aminoacyl-tRNA deacylase [Anaerolineae bacterium]|nr:D-aminoacyl-tRNA deacylase [Anaerolineae bacterium]MDW8172329.1 D-aminoacyl-tRNA deacylase [Anaerolineae bacterium]